MQKQKIKLEIEGFQKINGGSEDQINLNELGFLYQKHGYYYLFYQDHSPGIDGAKTLFKIDEKKPKIFLSRSKPAKMKQVFKKGERISGIYHTDYGQLNLESETKNLEVNLGNLIGLIKIKYNLYINGNLSTENQLRMFYKGSEKKYDQ